MLCGRCGRRIAAPELMCERCSGFQKASQPSVFGGSSGIVGGAVEDEPKIMKGVRNKGDIGGGTPSSGRGARRRVGAHTTVVDLEDAPPFDPNAGYQRVDAVTACRAANAIQQAHLNETLKRHADKERRLLLDRQNQHAAKQRLGPLTAIGKQPTTVVTARLGTRLRAAAKAEAHSLEQRHYEASSTRTAKARRALGARMRRSRSSSSTATVYDAGSSYYSSDALLTTGSDMVLEDRQSTLGMTTLSKGTSSGSTYAAFSQMYAPDVQLRPEHRPLMDKARVTAQFVRFVKEGARRGDGSYVSADHALALDALRTHFPHHRDFTRQARTLTLDHRAITDPANPTNAAILGRSHATTLEHLQAELERNTRVTRQILELGADFKPWSNASENYLRRRRLDKKSHRPIPSCITEVVNFQREMKAKYEAIGKEIQMKRLGAFKWKPGHLNKQIDSLLDSLADAHKTMPMAPFDDDDDDASSSRDADDDDDAYADDADDPSTVPLLPKAARMSRTASVRFADDKRAPAPSSSAVLEGDAATAPQYASTDSSALFDDAADNDDDDETLDENLVTPEESFRTEDGDGDGDYYVNAAHE